MDAENPLGGVRVDMSVACRFEECFEDGREKTAVERMQNRISVHTEGRKIGRKLQCAPIQICGGGRGIKKVLTIQIEIAVAEIPGERTAEVDISTAIEQTSLKLLFGTLEEVCESV